MRFLDQLLAGGLSYKVDRRDASATLTPSSQDAADHEAFQSLVKQIKRNEGDGYTARYHPSSDRGGIDLVLITFE